MFFVIAVYAKELSANRKYCFCVSACENRGDINFKRKSRLGDMF